MSGRIAFDQTTAWLLAVLFTFGIFGGIFFISKTLAQRQHKDNIDEIEATHAFEGALEDSKKPDDGSGDPGPDQGPDAAWSYTNAKTGPSAWGELSPKYELCKTGKSQSPVNIDSAIQAHDSIPIKFQYKEAAVVVDRNPLMLTAKVEPGSFIFYNGENYELTAAQFHIPGEHTLNSVPFDMEVHLVHQSNSGKTAIIAIFAVDGLKNHPIIAQLWGKIDQDVESSLKINFSGILPRKSSYYYYPGSLTQPPCTEQIDWLVMKEPITLSSNQIDIYAKKFHTNARPTQPLNDRQIVVTQD